MKLSNEELQRRGRLEALNQIMRGVTAQLDIYRKSYLEDETRDVAYQASENLRLVARALMDPNVHPSVQPAVFIDVMDRREFGNAVARERARHKELGYTRESDREKGAMTLLAIANDYARKGKVVEAAAINLAVQDLILDDASVESKSVDE